VAAKEFFVRPDQHVENRIADAENVVLCVSHSVKIPLQNPVANPLLQNPVGIIAGRGLSQATLL
jgi:hypothetical protein